MAVVLALPLPLPLPLPSYGPSLPFGATPRTRARAGLPAAPEPYGAGCRATVSGSQATAYCHNP
ncbi:hypothetical protein [Streptomyces sp. NPDC047453]|uniref:hypothetical protein n=1 Tax=Streptomyces sp. NPDC047453 TaxID=3154812 RepID=UPI0033FBC86F